MPGIESLSINGPLYALNRGTGKLEWVCDFLPHQMMLLEEMRDLPVLLFTTQYNKSANGFDRRMVKVTAVDKRNGKLVYDREFNPVQPFHTLRIDPQAGQIDLVRGDMKIEFRVGDGQTAQAGPLKDRQRQPRLEVAIRTLPDRRPADTRWPLAIVRRIVFLVMGTSRFRGDRS